MANSRGYGLGSLVQRDGVYYLRYQVNGKRKAVSLHCKTLAEAEAAADAIYSKSLQAADSKEQIAVHIGEAKKLIKAVTHKVKLSDVWTIYKASPSRPQSSDGTLGNYERCWTWFADWLKPLKVEWLSEVTAEMANDYAKHLGAKNTSASTYNYHIGALRLICRVLGDAAALEVNPFAIIQRKTGVKQTRKEFSVDEVQAILAGFDHLTDHPDRKPLHLLNADEMRVLFHLLAFSGLRLADAGQLKWSSIAKGLITCSPVKTRHVASSRKVHIPICPELAESLKDAKEWQAEQEYVLPKIAERYKRNIDGVAGDCIRVLEWNGFTERNGAKQGKDRRMYGVHSFRHFFASHCAMNNIPIALLADILGDNISTLQRYYIHAGDAGRKQVTAAMQLAVKAPALPASLEMASEGKLTDKDKLQRIADVLSQAKKPTKELQAILAILQS